MQIKPLGNRVLVEPDPIEKITKSGIMIPDYGEEEKPRSGTIAAIGKDVMMVGLGDKVIFGKYAGAEVVSAGKTLVFMIEEDIYAITKKAPVQ